MKKKLSMMALIGASALTLAGCGNGGGTGNTGNSSGGAAATPPMDLTLISQESEEAFIDDNIVKDLIQAKYPNINITIKKTTAGSSLTHSALLSNSAQVYVGYDGTEFTGSLGQTYTGSYKTDPSSVLKYVQQQEMKKWNIWVSPSLGFQDTYAIAVRAATAQKYNLKTDSDLVQYAPNWVVATDNTFQQRVGDGYSDFTKLYGLKFKQAKAMSYDLMYTALSKGDVNAAIVYSTDGRLKKLNEVTLTDPKNFFPPYNGIVLATQKAYKTDNLDQVLKPLYGKLTTADMTQLNYLVTVKKQTESKVAHDWLVQKGLLSQ